MLDVATTTDAALAELREQHAAQRWNALRRFAGLLSEREALRPGLSADHAADILWTVCAQANYDSLVIARGRTADEYRTWLADTLIRALLPIS